LDWQPERAEAATLRIRCTGLNELTWESGGGNTTEFDHSSLHRSAIRSGLEPLRKRFGIAEELFTAKSLYFDERNRLVTQAVQLPEGLEKWTWRDPRARLPGSCVPVD
jgi:hypothetical protein